MASTKHYMIAVLVCVCVCACVNFTIRTCLCLYMYIYTHLQPPNATNAKSKFLFYDSRKKATKPPAPPLTLAIKGTLKSAMDISETLLS